MLFAFIAAGTGGTVTRLNIDNGAVVRQNVFAYTVAYAGGKVVVSQVFPASADGAATQQVQIFDAITMTRLATIESAGKRWLSTAVGEDVFLHGYTSIPGDLIRVSTASNTLTNTYDVRGRRGEPGQIAYGHGSLWVPRDTSDTGQLSYNMRVLRVDPSDGSVAAEVLTNDNSSGQIGLTRVVATTDYVYAASFGFEKIYKIDPSNNTLVATFNVKAETGYSGSLSSSALTMTTAGSDLYLLNRASGLVKVNSGGTFTVLANPGGGLSATQTSLRHFDGQLYHAFVAESGTRTHLRIYDLDGNNVTPPGGGNITTQGAYTGWRWDGGSGSPGAFDMTLVELGSGWGVNTITW